MMLNIHGDTVHTYFPQPKKHKYKYNFETVYM